jgi:hypothetical protein
MLKKSYKYFVLISVFKKGTGYDLRYSMQDALGFDGFGLSSFNAYQQKVFFYYKALKMLLNLSKYCVRC